MNIKVVGQAAVITSALSTEDIKKLQRYDPRALKLFEGDKGKDEKFSVSYVDNKAGGAGKFGVQFNATSADGKAQYTYPLGNIEADKRTDFVKSELGMPLYMLGEVETQAAAALSGVTSKLEAITSNMVVE